MWGILLIMVIVFVLLNLIPSAAVLADDAPGEIIHIEAENPNSSNFTVNKVAFEGLSGGYMLSLQKTSLPEEGSYKVSYNINIPERGLYSFIASTQSINSIYTSNYYVQVNEGDLISARDCENVEFICQEASVPNYGTINKYDFGKFTLDPGENTISFVVYERRQSDNNRIVFFSDYFELERVWVMEDLVISEPLGIFEENQPITCTLCSSFNAPTDHSYSYNITDFWGTGASTGNFVLTAGTKDLPISIQNPGTGWFQLNISEGGAAIFSKPFTVVPLLSERIQTDSPFATDFAGNWLVGRDKLADYIRAIKLAGIKWIRDRFSWDYIEPANNTYKFGSSDFAVNALSNAGLNILNVFGGAPEWARPGGGLFPDNLFDIYDFIKNTAIHYAGKVQAWEIWNEPDLGKYKESADLYTAMFKAGAIGVVDSGDNPLKVHGGFAYHPTVMDYSDLALQNGLMAYSDMYNYHNHIKYEGKSVHHIKPKKIAESVFGSWAYDTENRPIWVSEAGIALPVSSADNIPDYEKLVAQARYIVTSTVESLAAGNGKHFWFIIPHWVGSSGEMGAFGPQDTPYPCYAAESVMTKVLGQGKYKGVLKNMPQGAHGHLFNTGTGDVAVIWSENPASVQLKSNISVKVIDIMGGESTVNSNNDYVNIQISPDPVYVSFEGTCDQYNYLNKEYIDRNLVAHSLTQAERVVLVQKLPDSAKIEVRNDGYKISETSPTVMAVDVYNFNNMPMSGIVRGSSEGGLTIKSGIAASPDETSGETLHIEAENPSSSNFTVKKVAFEGLSNGYMLSLQSTTLPEGESYVVSYNVNISEGGDYSLIASTQSLESIYTSNYYVQVNGGALINARENNKFISQEASVPNYGDINKYNLGTFALNPGENTISFVINERRESDNNRIVFFSDCFELVKKQESTFVQVGAMSKVTVNFTIFGNENVIPNVISFLRFDGRFNDGDTSPSVSRICMLDNEPIQPDGLFPNANNPSAWNINNITAGANATATVGQDGALTFKCNFSGGDRWFYPGYNVSNPSILADKDGLVFWIYFGQDEPDSSINVFARFTDGRKYYLGDPTSIKIKQGWRQIYVPWSRFIFNYSPIGAENDTRPFDQTLINQLSIGINTKHDDFSPYSIKEFGYYTGPDGRRLEDKNIIISGISDNAIVGTGSLIITATLPEGIIAEKTRVLLMEQEYQYSRNGSELSINLSNIEPGSYKLSIVAYTPAGYAVRKQLNFTKTE